MDWLQALILGIIQGLTEYLPVSSSGHLEIGNALLGVEIEENLTFDVMLHVATVLSTLVVLWSEIDWIMRGLFKFQMNAETKYALNNKEFRYLRTVIVTAAVYRGFNSMLPLR